MTETTRLYIKELEQFISVVGRYFPIYEYVVTGKEQWKLIVKNPMIVTMDIAAEIVIDPFDISDKEKLESVLHDIAQGLRTNADNFNNRKSSIIL